MSVRILLADDHTLMRQGLRRILESEGDFDIVNESSSGIEAVEAARLLKPDVAIVDVGMKELNGIRGSMPVTQKELEYNKQSIIRRFPAGFETNFAISNQLSNLVVYGLSDTYFNDYIAKVNAVTLDDVNRVAKKYLDPDKMAIVIVGDRKVIEPGLKTIPTWGSTLRILDLDGKQVD